MDLLCITDASKKFEISSKTLRYYENVGILKSIRMEDNKYRYYDDEAIERIKQILILRKMQITIKDIIRIYENENMSTVVEVFVERINAIDEQVGALSELKNITNEFLQTMLKNGITKISALPLLYDEMDKQLTVLEEHKPLSFDDLSAVSEKLAKPLEPAIVSLSAMRVISSYLKEKPQESDTEGFGRWIQTQNIGTGEPGRHERFEFQSPAGDVIIQCVPDDFQNNSNYDDFIFDGGLFATVSIYLDEDLGEQFRSLIKCFDDNKYYQIDYLNDGELRHPAMLENLISSDDKREMVSLLVPVKKRMADPELFDPPKEIAEITVAEIEAANPILWMVDVPFDTLNPINNPHYRILDNGELEYTGWISTRVLSTEVKVKLPFRVDIEFRVGDDKLYGYGATEESVIFYHGEHGLNHNYGFGINMENNPDANLSAEAIIFHQPVFRDKFNFPKRGKINNGVNNKLTWIIGEKHFAVIINDEIRYCGINFPYMEMDLSREQKKSIVIGSNGQGMKFFKSIRVSQLVYTQKNKIKKEELIMVTKQSNNIIPTIHRLVTDEYGENYWINGCAKYVMECLGEPDYDYWFFAGIIGDIFTQHYSYTNLASESASGYLAEDNSVKFYEDTFLKCGYAATFVSGEEVLKNTEMYLQTLIAYIDKGIPVIRCGGSTGVFVGYEDYGKILLYITGNKNEPERIELEKVFESKPFHGYGYKGGWIFVGDKKASLPLADIYRKAIKDIIPMQSIKTDTYCFGAEAFRAWASDIENGKFDRMNAEEFDTWCDHTNYVCVLATNGSCCHSFLNKARELNPDMTFLEEVSRLYESMKPLWNDLEALGGGFNVTFEVLQNKEKRGKIAAKIREFADVTDEIVRVLEVNHA